LLTLSDLSIIASSFSNILIEKKSINSLSLSLSLYIYIYIYIYIYPIYSLYNNINSILFTPQIFSNLTPFYISIFPYNNRKMLLWHSSFSYFCLTLWRIKCNLVWQWERKLHLLWLTWIRFVLLQECFCHLHFENVGQFERENQIWSLISLILPRAEGERTEKNKAIYVSVHPTLSMWFTTYN